MVIGTEGGDGVFHVHLNASPAELEHRYATRKSELKEYSTYAEARRHGTEAQVGTLADIADVTLEAEHSGAETLAVTVMAMLGTPVNMPDRLVDVIVGGQYGSEGKGNICAKIAAGYGALMRIGGPNAGHQVFYPKYKYVQLPSGTGSNKEALILIGAGSTLWLPTLLKEIGDHGLRRRIAARAPGPRADGAYGQRKVWRRDRPTAASARGRCAGRACRQAWI